MAAQSYATVETFFSNRDAHAAFLARVAARLVEWAVVEREAIPPAPTALEVARQQFAVAVLSGVDGAMGQARRLLPELAIKANAAGLIDANGNITATDAQIAATVVDALIDLHAGYVPGLLQ